MRGAVTANYQLVAEYEAGATIKQIGAKHGLSYSAVRDRLLRAGVTMRSAGRRRPTPPPGLAEDYEHGLTLREIAVKHGLTFSTVRRQLLVLGVKLRAPGTPTNPHW